MQDVYFDCDQESANYDDRSHQFPLGSQARPETSSLRPILYDQCTRFHPVAEILFISTPIITFFLHLSPSPQCNTVKFEFVLEPTVSPAC